MNTKLKLSLALLALIFPIGLVIIAYVICIYTHNTSFLYPGVALALFLGVAFNYMCIYRKIFAILLYQVPLPFIFTFVFWRISMPLIGNQLALISAALGLSLGLLLNKAIVIPNQFYKIKKRTLIAVYLFLSLVTMGLFVGIPVFNLLIGVLAGNYISIRIISYYIDDHKMTRRHLYLGSLFTGLVLFMLSLLASLFLLLDIDALNQTLTLFHVKTLAHHSYIYLFIFGSLLLGIVQYLLTYFTASTMLQFWKAKRTKEPA